LKKKSLGKKMNYRVIFTKDFDRDVKKLLKKYRSIKADVDALKKELLKNPTMGDPLGGSAYKVRMAITSKGGGKRGGARVITCNMLVDVENSEIYLLSIYDKSEVETVSQMHIKYLKLKNGLR